MIHQVVSKEIEELYRTSIVKQTACWSRGKNQLGCCDYPLKVDPYNAFRNFEYRSQGYRTN